MIILIGGETHSGKTLIAQRLLERYGYPYISLDHIKMGLIRGYGDCGFTALDSDALISEKMWGVVKGIIDTCRENRQNIIIEGCYLPPEEVCGLKYNDIAAVYIILSKEYIEKNFNKIIGYENIIERRKYPAEPDMESLIIENSALKKKCQDADVQYFEIKSDYNEEIKRVYNYIDGKIPYFRKYASDDIDQIAALFHDTVHTVCAKDYAPEQLNAWSIGEIDKSAWDKSLLEHYTIVAEIGGKIVGFGDITDGYIDRTYVHKDYQGKGIAAAIVNKLEQYAASNGSLRITSHVSITARPFFEKRGYKIIKEQHVERRGQTLTNYVMERTL